MPGARRFLVVVLVVAGFAAWALPARAIPIGERAFVRTWARTDRPVLERAVSRTWMWGPEAHAPLLLEPYAQSPGGQRVVQYFDKSRMEVTNPSGDVNSPWYVTNGLLAKELVTGRMQRGDTESEFDAHAPAQVNIAGDQDDPDGPTYATFTTLVFATPLPDGAAVTQRVNRAGILTDDPSLAMYGVTAGHRVSVPGIDHQVASVFWTFMSSSGQVYEGDTLTTAPLFPDPYYATGYPISEAYWATVRVAGTPRDVLMQCFERRCLTYTPGNPEGWLVEAGNVGQHYYAWRYEQLGQTSVPAPLPSTGDVRVTFVNYDPPGTEATDEYVDIRNHDQIAIQLQGWKLQDDSGDSFTFPAFVLPPGASLRVHNCDGADNSTDIYTGRCSAWWNNGGDKASLFDAAGALVSTYGY